MMVSYHITTWCHNPEDHNVKNLKSSINKVYKYNGSMVIYIQCSYVASFTVPKGVSYIAEKPMPPYCSLDKKVTSVHKEVGDICFND
jgi:hypothetical protein